MLTFDGDKDGLLDEELRLDEHAADVGALVHPLLDIAQLQGSILKHHLHNKRNILNNQTKYGAMTTVLTNHTQVFQDWCAATPNKLSCSYNDTM